MKYTIYIYDQANTRFSTRIVEANTEEEALEKALISYGLMPTTADTAVFRMNLVKALDTGIAAINQLELKEGEKR